MKRLDFETVKQICVGAVELFETDEGIVARKCTEKQSEGWLGASETLHYRSLTTTGVRLDFHTNSKKMHFAASSGKKFEVLINGAPRALFTAEDGDIDETVDICMPSGTYCDDMRVTLIFPSHSIGILKYIEMDDGATVIPNKYDRRIMFIGDSITQGHASKYDSLSYAWQTSLFFNAESIINGIGGAFYHVPTFDKPAFDPDTIILAYGTNDAVKYKNDEAKMYSQVTGYMDLIKQAYSDKQIIVISPTFRSKDNLDGMGEWFRGRRSMIEIEGAKRGFHVISGEELVPPLPDFFSDTYLHPNDLGFTVYALRLIQKLTGIIK